MAKWNRSSNKQKGMAKRFAEHADFSVSQAMKYIDECFKLARGEMSQKEFREQTGLPPHTLRF